MANPWDADAKKNLDGFSSNSGWASEDALSDNPTQPGPKAGFHDPIDATPARKQLWQGGSEPVSEDDMVTTSLSGGTL